MKSAVCPGGDAMQAALSVAMVSPRTASSPPLVLLSEWEIQQEKNPDTRNNTA